MSTIIYQLTLSSNWVSLWDGTYTAQSVSPQVLEQFYPLEPITIPLEINNHILACYVFSATAKETWRYAGKALFKLRTGITVPASFETVFFTSKIWLNQIALFFVPDLSDEFTITFEIPYWIRDVRIILWQYIGTTNDRTQIKLDEILTKLP